MKTVLLVGAGATLAEAVARRLPRHERPPLDTTFFELCRLAQLAGRAPVESFMKAHYGINPFDGRWRMEEVFNYIYSDAFSPSPPDGCLEAYWALLRMYAEAIGQTTNGLPGTGRTGVGGLLRHLNRSGSPPDITVITFNQDLVIEKALESMRATKLYSKIAWNIRRAYELDFEWPTFRGPTTQFRAHASDESIAVLKLHGSLNWVYNVRSGTDPKNSLRSPGKKLRCLNEQTIFHSLRYNTGKRDVDVVPLIVPPIYEKASRYRDVVAPLWQLAAKVLEEAERLIVFGYSFPDTDFAARSLFRRCVFENKPLQTVSVIDVNPDVAAKIATLMEVDTVHFHRSVPAFCARDDGD